ncbi:unnamed protein product [Cuscuta europaea]|uniref:Uncharacterized protein n=1 Tax=Cuscuta europaea TaxID=41803 RepID=A0A9P1EKX8_CUSEU|nr:unnamed protein product [Cuscuta europaea]
MMEARGAAEGEAASLRKKLADAEESLRLATESMEDRVRVTKAEGKNEGLAEAGEAAAEAARVAAEEVERAKAEEVAKAGKAAVEAFMTGGWMAEDKEDWVSSVVEKKVDAWVGGPGKMWLAERSDSYYQCGEFFTQRLIYRKLAQHFNVSPVDFKPEAYGLPPR